MPVMPNSAYIRPLCAASMESRQSFTRPASRSYPRACWGSTLVGSPGLLVTVRCSVGFDSEFGKDSRPFAGVAVFAYRTGLTFGAEPGELFE